MKIKYVALVGLLVSGCLFGQADRGIITGLVTDPAGAAIANAEVQVKDAKTGVVTTLKTSSEGNYSTPPLIIGTYEVAVALPGFKAFHASDINLASGQTFRQDVALQVGEVQQSVEVNAEERAAECRQSAGVGVGQSDDFTNPCRPSWPAKIAFPKRSSTRSRRSLLRRKATFTQAARSERASTAASAARLRTSWTALRTVR